MSVIRRPASATLSSQTLIGVCLLNPSSFSISARPSPTAPGRCCASAHRWPGGSIGLWHASTPRTASCAAVPPAPPVARTAGLGERTTVRATPRRPARDVDLLELEALRALERPHQHSLGVGAVVAVPSGWVGTPARPRARVTSSPLRRTSTRTARSPGSAPAARRSSMRAASRSSSSLGERSRCSSAVSPTRERLGLLPGRAQARLLVEVVEGLALHHRAGGRPRRPGVAPVGGSTRERPRTSMPRERSEKPPG